MGGGRGMRLKMTIFKKGNSVCRVTFFSFGDDFQKEKCSTLMLYVFMFSSFVDSSFFSFHLIVPARASVWALKNDTQSFKNVKVGVSDKGRLVRNSADFLRSCLIRNAGVDPTENRNFTVGRNRAEAHTTHVECRNNAPQTSNDKPNFQNLDKAHTPALVRARTTHH